MINYGIPYMGSKAGIIPSIAMNFPKAEHFYDLFGGGFSVSHYMIEKKSSRYSYFHYNEIKKDITELVKKAINGDFNYSKFKPEWISSEAFDARKHDDPYIRICWSFGNNQKGYMFSKDIEPYKRSMHMAVVFDEFDSLAEEVLGFGKWPDIAKTIKQKRYYLRQKIEWYRKTKIPKILHQFLKEKQLQRLKKLQQLEQLQQLKQLEPLEQLERLEQLEQLEQLKQLKQLEPLEQLERLEQLEQLERLEQLEQLERLSITSNDYRDVDILPKSIVYCDIPYKGTDDYGNKFNHEEFFDWAASREFPVYISEYEISDSRFKCFYNIEKRPMLSNATKIVKMKTEKLYWNGKSL